MTFEEFQRSLEQSAPPENLSEPLKALWWAANENWEKAHQIAQEVSGRDGSWVHAYLHRQEGDLGNAAYWYSRAGRSQADSPLEVEWAGIVQELLKSPA